MRDLRDTCCEFYSLKGCQGCGREKIASCQGRLISFEHVFLDFVIEHFGNEEKIMSEISRTQDTNEYFRLHQQKLNRGRTTINSHFTILSISRTNNTTKQTNLHAINQRHASTFGACAAIAQFECLALH